MTQKLVRLHVLLDGWHRLQKSRLRNAILVQFSNPGISEIGSIMFIILTQAREYVFTDVGLSVCDHDN